MKRKDNRPTTAGSTSQKVKSYVRDNSILAGVSEALHTMALVIVQGKEDISWVAVSKEQGINRFAGWYILTQRSCRSIADGIEPLHGRHIGRVVHGHDD